MSIIKKNEEIKEVIDCFLVNILENEDNLVIDSQKNEDDAIVFNTNINWKWSNRDNLELHIWDNENKVSLPVNSLAEDEDSFDKLYVDDLFLTVL